MKTPEPNLAGRKMLLEELRKDLKKVPRDLNAPVAMPASFLTGAFGPQLYDAAQLALSTPYPTNRG